MTDIAQPLTIAGMTPASFLMPDDRAELLTVIASLAAQGATFAFIGGATHLSLGNTPHHLDAVIRTTALRGVLEYAPEDQTITVEAGMTFATLDSILAEHDQMLPIDVGNRERATIGGAIATNAYGARRHRYGSIKDLIVGIEIVRPDGVAVRGGGKVVKNVAGFDLPKLMVGALGTLGGILSATFRVFPRPAASRDVRMTLETATLPFDVETFRALPLDPTFARVAQTPISRVLDVRFESSAIAVNAQCSALIAAAAERGVHAVFLDEGSAAQADAYERKTLGAGPWRTREIVPPARAGVAIDAAWASGLPNERVLAYPTLGVTFRAGPLTGCEPAADLVDAVRSAISGSLVVEAMDDDARSAVDAWGAPPDALAVMQALKRQFDPADRCNPGRFLRGMSL